MAVCDTCRAENPDTAQFCQTCGTRLGPRAAPGFAGFWKRFAAIILDAIIVSFGGAILFGAASVAGGFASLFLPWIYEAAMLSSQRQATVGKMALGIIVTDVNGRPLSFGRATGRHFAKYISALLLGIGFLMAAFTQKRQALHDMIADTLVVVDMRP